MYGKGVFYEGRAGTHPAAHAEAKESKIDAIFGPEYDVDTIDDDGVVTSQGIGEGS